MPEREEAQRRLRRRGRRDRLTTAVVSLGGGTVLLLIAGMLFYLLAVAAPLFTSASVADFERVTNDAPEPAPQLLELEESGEFALRAAGDGPLEIIDLHGAGRDARIALPGPTPQLLRNASRDGHLLGLLADHTLRFLEVEFVIRFDGAERRRVLRSTRPFDSSAVDLARWTDAPLVDLALWLEETRLTIAFADERGAVCALRFEDVERGFALDDGPAPRAVCLTQAMPAIEALHLGSGNWLHVRAEDGTLRSWDLRFLDAPLALREVRLPQDVVESAVLVGGAALLTARPGEVTQWLPVRLDDGALQLTPVRRFEIAGTPLALLPEARRRGFATLAQDDGRNATLDLHHSTAERRLLEAEALPTRLRAAALSARGDGLLLEGVDGGLWFAGIDNRHPEASFSALLTPTWYEGYEAPRHSWQSSAASDEAEPKFGLSPLMLGTLKAALYGMVFALPIAVLGAVYTALFMAPVMRRWVKPGVEVMAALPTVVLGFLAGLWLAPLVERNLTAVLLSLAALPVSALCTGAVVGRLPEALRLRLPDGWQMLLVAPLLVLAVVLATTLAPAVDALLFAGDLRTWLSETRGIDYDQRNAIVVGLAMAMAVIPVVFAITEDAVHAVPRNLAHGALALGATRWETFRHIVLPTASPGIFSALLIGFGRAVGETMIVLMASGNTPVLDAGPFSGMRTLAANLAVELPESEVASTHYRILFLTALVLFVFTFSANTLGEFVRQRLRTRYGGF